MNLLFKRTKYVSIIFVVVVFLGGCVSLPKQTPVLQGYDSNALKILLEQRLTVDKSTKKDVLDLLGKPHVRSVDEYTNIYNIKRTAFFEQWGFTPYEVWTYVQAKDPKEAASASTIRVLGMAVFSKDIKTIVFMFNQEGKLLGYQITSHYL